MFIFSRIISHYFSVGPLSKEKQANQWWLWRMMDVPTANQSQTSCHTWVGQEGWSSCTQLPSFQHLTLNPTCDQRPCYEHSQASIQGTLQVNHARQIAHDPRVSSIVSAAKNIPPPSLPLSDKGAQPYMTNQIPLNSTYSQHQAMSPPFTLSHTHQVPQNAAWSPHEEHMHIGSGVPGPDAYHNHGCSPEPAFGLGNVKTSDGFVKSPASPSPTPLHQPPDGVSSHYIGLFIWIWII